MTERSDDELLETLQAQLEVEYKIKDGAENLLQVFSQGEAEGTSAAHAGGGGGKPNGGAAKEQLMKQVREELQSALTKIEAIKRQMDAAIVRMDSQIASTSREKLEQSSPSALGLQQYGRAIPSRFQSRTTREDSFSKADNDAFALRSQTVSLMHSLQSLLPDAVEQISVKPPRSFSVGTESFTPQRSYSPMGPPITPSMTRSAQRSRAAALAANNKGTHTRTPSHATGLGDLPRRRMEVMAKVVDNLDKSARIRCDLPIDDLIACAFPCLADQAGKEVRASAYRLLRHAMVRPPWALVRGCRQAGLDLYLARTLLRDTRFDLEKEQALKLIRTIMDCGSSDREGEELISVAVIRSLVAAADHSEEKLRTLYIETLVELAIHDTPLLLRGGGLRTVLQTITDGPYELSQVIMTSLLTLVDMPATREHLRPGYDLEVALSSLTEAREDVDSIKSASRVVSIMLRSWPGLFYLCLYEKRALTSLVIALEVNGAEVQDTILDLFCDLMTLRGARVAQQGKAVGSASSAQRYAPLASQVGTSQVNLYDHYLALLVLTLIECGIVEAIVHVLEVRSELSRKATLLMGHLTHIAAHHLPSEYGVRLHALPNLFQAVFLRAAENKKSSRNDRQGESIAKQEKASLALRAIDHYDRESARDGLPSRIDTKRDRSNSALTTRSRATSSSVDEFAFRNALFEANVLTSKDHTKWNIDALLLIFEGIPGHPRRLDEVIRVNKLVKRVLAFYHPFALQYSTVANTSRSQKYTKLACTILTALMSHAEGIRFLAEDRFLKEIRDSLETDLMAQQRTSDTLTIGYFEMLGTLSRTEEGQQMMYKANLFSALHRSVEEGSSSAMVNAILSHFDFTIEGHCRVLLSKILTGSRPSVRRHATQTIADMIRPATPERWLLSLLVTQIYDSMSEVRDLACDLLLDACNASSLILEIVVSMRPILEETSQSLLLKFMSTRVGLQYLLQGDYVDREMDDWFNYRNHLYTVQLEVLTARGFDINRSQDDSDLHWDGRVPPHFYGELTKTKQGCLLLEQKGHFADFAHFIRLHGGEEEDTEIIAKLKSTLWAVGNIGATGGGVPFLEAEDLVGTIVQIALSSPVYSLRGTCYFILGLIATTPQGAELLEDHGWLTFSSSNGVEASPLGSYCIPPPKFLQTDAWKASPPYTSDQVIPAPETKTERAIMLAISNLGNSIVANRASRTLAKIKGRNRRLFLRKGMELFVRSLMIADSHHLRQPIRRYIWELFEIRLDQDCVDQVLLWKERLMSGRVIKHQRSYLSSAVPSALEQEQQREGDEVLGTDTAGLDDGEGDDEEDMDGEGEEEGDDDNDDYEGEEDDEEDEEELSVDGGNNSSFNAAEVEEEEGSEVSSMQRAMTTMHLQPPTRTATADHAGGGGGLATVTGGRAQKGHRNASFSALARAPESMPKKKVIGGFSLAESLVAL